MKECQCRQVTENTEKQVLDETEDMYGEWNTQDFLNHLGICNLILTATDTSVCM